MAVSLLQGPLVAAAGSQIAAVTVSAALASVPADGTTSATVVASVYDAQGDPVAGVTLSFATTLGTLATPSAVTDAQGQAEVGLTSTEAGQAVVTATAPTGSPSGSAAVTFTTPPPGTGTPARVVVAASPASVPADGTSASTVTATVYNQAGTVLPNVSLTLTTTLGCLHGSGGYCSTVNVTTGTDGQAIATLSSGSAGTAQVTAAASGVSGSAGVTFVAPATAATQVQLSASPLSVPADGQSASTVTATVYDASGPVGAGVGVVFATTLGTLNTTYGTTDGQGQASVTLTSASPGTAAVTATAGAASAVASVRFTAAASTPAAITVTAAPAVAPPDGTSAVTFTATVENAAGQPIANADVNWATTLGHDEFGDPGIGACYLANPTPPFFQTDSAGQVQACLTSTTPGTAVVTATAGDVSGSAMAVFSPTAAVQSVVLTAAPASVAADGTAASTVTATVYGASGPLTGVAVSFATTLGTFSPGSTATTDAAGQAAVQITSTSSGTAAVTATAGQAAGAATIDFTGGSAAARVVLQASPQAVPADGITASTVTATVYGTSGAPAPNATVNLGTTLGEFQQTCSSYGVTYDCSSAEISLTTNAQGQVQAPLVALGQPGTAEITATSDGAAAEAAVTFTAAPVSRIVLTVSPVSVPANGSSAASVTAMVYDAAGGLLQDVPVTFETTLGQFCQTEGGGNLGCPAANSLTVKSGRTVFDLQGDTEPGPAGQASVPLFSSFPGTATVTATSGQASAVATVSFAVPAAVSQVPASVRLSVSPALLPADGVATATVTAAVYDAAGAPVAGTYVQISASAGALSGGADAYPGVFVRTDANGIASATLTAPTNSEVATLRATAYVGNPTCDPYYSYCAYSAPAATAVTPVTFTPPPVSLTLSATREPADGVSGASVTVTVVGASGIPLPNTSVDLVTTLGTLSRFTLYGDFLESGTAINGQTDAKGQFTVTLTSTTPGTASVTATTDQGQSATGTVTFSPSALGRVLLSAAPDSVPADGTTTATVTATVYDGAGDVLAGAPVFFGTASGVSTAYVSLVSGGQGYYGYAILTGATGQATVGVRSSQVGTAVLQAQVGTIVGVASVGFSPVVLGSVALALTPQSVPADGTSKATVSATVYDSAGAPLPGVGVAIATTVGLFADGYNWDLLTSDGAGQVSETLTSAVAGGATVTATAWYQNPDGRWTEMAQAGSVRFTPPGAVAKVDLTVTPTQVPADGTGTATLTATVLGTGGIPVPDATVTFSATGGVFVGGSCSDYYEACDAVTGASGQATLALASTQVGTVAVTAWVDGVEATGSVVFTAPAAPVASIQLATSQTTVVADGNQTATLTATVTSAAGHPVAGAAVEFSTPFGCFEDILANVFCDSSGSVTTDASGQATVVLADRVNDTGQAIVEAALNNGYPYATAVVDFVPAPAVLQVTATPAGVPADGTSAATVTATVYDSLGDPVPGIAVDLQSNLASVDQNTFHTDAAGQVTASVTSQTSGTATVTASAEQGDLENSTTILFTPVPASVDLAISPPVVPANGMDSATVTATVYGAGGQPLPGARVSFGTTLGYFALCYCGGPASDLTTWQVTTDAHGQASAQLVSGTAGTAAVTASAEGTSAEAGVTFALPETNPLSLAVTASPAGVPADGVSAATVAVRVLGPGGSPVPDACLSLATTLGDFAGGQAQVGLCTGSTGQAQTTLTATAAGVAAVTATDGLVSGGATVAFTVPAAGPPASLDVSVSPGSVPADGLSAASIAVSVKNAAGQALAGQIVDFSSTAGVLSPQSGDGGGVQATTDPAGVAVAQITSLQPGSAVVTAAVGPLVGSATVTFTAAAPAPAAAASLRVSVSPAAVPADGVSVATVSAVVDDAAGAPVAGAPVFFAASGGTLAATAVTTDAQEVAAVAWTASGVGSAVVTATVGDGSLSASAVEDFTPVVALVAVAAAQGSIPADGKSSTVLTATVSASGGAPLVGVPVTFATDEGSLCAATGCPLSQTATAQTDAAGTASVTLTSATRVGTATITAAVGDAAGATMVNYTDPAAHLALSVAPASVPADGVSAASVMATVTDELGNPVAGVQVTGITSLGTLVPLVAQGGVQHGYASTDAAGQATFRVVSTTPGAATITVSDGVSERMAVVPFTPVPSPGSITLQTTAAVVPADGSSTATLTASVQTPAGQPVPGLPVTFCGTLGQFPTGLLYDNCAVAITGAQGTASVPLDSRQAGVATVSAQIGALSAATVVDFANSAARVDLTAAPGVALVDPTAAPGGVLADGQSATTVTATVYGADGQPLPGASVTLATTLGWLTVPGQFASPSLTLTTGSGGQASATVVSRTAGTAQVTATAGNAAGAAAVTFANAGRVTLSAAPATTPADGFSAARVTATVYGPDGNPVSGAQVTFSTSLGALSASPVTTDAQGQATVSLTATDPGTAVLTAASAGASAATDVLFTPALVSVTLAASPAQVPADGVRTTTLTATVDAAGAPVPGAWVDFSTTLGTFRAAGFCEDAGPCAQTDAQGQASVQLSSAVPGTAVAIGTVGASSGAAAITFAAAPALGRVLLTAAPQGVPADGQSAAQLSATVLGADGTPVAGVPVTFSTNLGSFGGRDVVTVSSDGSGVASANLTSTEPGAAAVTATAGAVSGAATVTFSQASAVGAVTVLVTPTSVPAGRQSGATVTATVYGPGGTPLVAVPVTLSTALGRFQQTCTSYYYGGGVAGTYPCPTARLVLTTDATGQVSAQLLSGTAGTAVITATAGIPVGSVGQRAQVSGGATVTFFSPVARLQLSASPATLPANGQDTAVLTATAYGAAGQPLPGVALAVGTTLGQFTGDWYPLVTNSQGQASFALMSAVPGQAQVTVSQAGLIGGPVAAATVSFTSAVAVGSVAVAADPVLLPADGAIAATVTATVHGASGQPLPGVTVAFGSQSGSTLSAQDAVTGADGQASTQITATVAGTYAVIATAGTASGVAQVQFTAVAPSVATHLTLSADPPGIQADGAQAGTITATVTDAAGDPVPGASVTLSATAGLFTASQLSTVSGTTDAVGVFTATLVSTSVGTAAVTATAGGLVATASIAFTPSSAGLELGAAPQSLAANGISVSTLTATLLGSSGAPVSGATVSFQTTLGSLSAASAITDAQGQAIVELSSAAPGTALVTAGADGQTGSVSVVFVSLAPATVNVAAAPGSLPADGLATTILTATVTDAQGAPLAGTTVTFSTSLGSLSTGSAATNAAGQASVTLTAATAPGTADVTVTAGTVSGLTTVAFTALTVAVTASAQELPADGRSTATITATVTSSTGTPLAGLPVGFATPLGILDSTSATTNGAGQASVTLTAATTAGMATVTANAFGVSASTKVLIGQAVVRLAAAPVNLPADGASTSTITATVQEGNGQPAAGITVSFATDLGSLSQPSAVTDAAGQAAVTLTAAGSPGTATVTATAAGAAGSLSVRMFALDVAIAASPTDLPADGRSVSALKATVTDASGVPVVGATVAFATTLGTLSAPSALTDAQGEAVVSLKAPAAAGAATVKASAGTAAATVQVTFHAGTLLFSDTAGTQPVWGVILPAPGQGSDQNAALPLPFAGVQFALDYQAGQHVVLSGDPYGQTPFCVDGNWQLDLVGSVTDTVSGSGCGGPVDLAAQNLPSGTYGAVLTLTATSGTTYGASDIYLTGLGISSYWMQYLPAVMSLYPLVVATQQAAPIPVGSTGTVPLLIHREPMTVEGLHTEASWDPSAISVAFKAASGGSGFQGGWIVPGHTGMIFDPPGNATVGSGLLSLVVTCLRPGTWPVSFAGTWWSSFGLAPFSSTQTVDCSAPAPGPSAVQGVTVDPADGSLYVTVTGTGLAGAATATLSDSGGAVVATTTNFALVDPTILTAHFAAVPAGLDQLSVYDGAGDLITRGTADLAVPPALPLFNLQQADLLGQKPGQPVTHIWRLTNYGPVDGTAVVLFQFPDLLTTEPTLNTSALPPGSWLLVHGTTGSGWYEIVAVPLASGQSADIAWTETVNPAVVFGSGSEISLGAAFQTATSVIDAFTAQQWAQYQGQGGLAVTAAGASLTQAGWASALGELVGMTGTDLASYETALTPSYPQLVQNFFGSNSSGFWPYLFNWGGGLFPIGYPAGTPDPGSEPTVAGVTVAGGTDPASGSAPTAAPAATVQSSAGGGGGIPDPGTTAVLNAAFNVTQCSASNPLLTGPDPSVQLLLLCGLESQVAQMLTSLHNCGLATFASQHVGWLISLLKKIPVVGDVVDTVLKPKDWYTQDNQLINWPAVKEGLQGYAALRDQWLQGNPQAVAQSFESNPALAKQDCAICYDDIQAGDTAALTGDVQVWMNGYGSDHSALQGVLDGLPVPTQYLNQNNQNGLTQYIMQLNQLSVYQFPNGSSQQTDVGNAQQVGDALMYMFTGNEHVTFQSGLNFNGQETQVPPDLWEHGIPIMETFHLDGADQRAASSSGTLNALFGGQSALPTWFNDCNNISLSGGYDPNDISASPAGVGGQGVIPAGQPITYTVRFENTGNASVTNVRVALQLDPALDPATVTPDGSSAGADTQFAFNAATDTVTWLLPNINLPPDTTPPQGEGWVSFTVTPKAGLPSGTSIAESAQVYFDYNPPVSTPTVVRTIDSAPPTVVMDLMPASEPAGPVTLAWSGNSAVGIASYEVYVSLNGGALEPWATTSGTSFTYPVASGNSYGFAVQATDVAGVSSSAPTAPQVSFRVAAAAVPPASPTSPTTSLTPVPASQTGSGATVGDAGGTLTTADGAFSMSVPAGAVPAGQTLQVSESTVPAAGTPSVPSGHAVASAYFTLTGPSLSQPVAAGVRYESSALGGLSPLRLGVWRDGVWQDVPTVVDASIGTVSFLVSSPGTFVVLANTQRFGDVPAGYWAQGDIDRLLAADVVNGYPNGTFQPNAPVSRAEFVKMLVLTLGLAPATGTTPFADVPAGAWYAPYVAAAAQAGIVDGLTPTTFGPSEELTREQMAVLRARALKLTKTAPLHFRDVSMIDAWAVQGVEEAVAAGYVNGFPNGSFQPLSMASRAQAAKVLAEALRSQAPSVATGGAAGD